ncbi:MAG TPA: glycosyltransferase family 39 protein [Bryobacteraceae bacterium]
MANTSTTNSEAKVKRAGTGGWVRTRFGTEALPRFLFWPVLAVIVIAAGALELASAVQETQTWDEGIHISAGYAYLTRGDFRWNQEHPPLAKLVAALPLLPLRLELPLHEPSWKKLDETQMGIDFLYHNGAPADTILMTARGSVMLLSLLFLIAVAWLVRRRFGSVAALLTAALCAFDPNLIAHARYVTTDYPVMAFYFLAALLWMEYLLDGRTRDLLLAALAFGLALVTKFSALLLVPALIVLFAIRWRQAPDKFSGRRALTAAAALIGIVLLLVTVLYWPETVRAWSGELPRLASVVKRGNPIGETLYRAGKWFRLPAHPFLTGLSQVASHNQSGHANYLLGMRSEKGWWYYFPVVFAVKSTLTALIATLGLVAAALWVLSRRTRLSFVWCAILLPPAIYFAISMTSAINIGMRHILPVYPFLYLAVAVLLTQAGARPWPRYAMFSLALLQIAECAWIAPNYLAFFNVLSGGPGNGPHYLVDSNIDWGQDVKKLKKWLAAHGTDTARVWYFGNASMDYYGIRAEPFPDPLDEKGWNAIRGYAVASVTVLRGVYVPLNLVAPLRLRKPVAKVGWSLYVYDFGNGAGN